MKTFLKTVKRNTLLFFKDKGLFFTSLITPLILLVLYATFLSNVYQSSFTTIFDMVNVEVEDKMINGLVGGQLMSSLLAVSCVTVSFCSNMLMVQDKISGAGNDILMSPVKRSTLAISYYVSTTISTLIICLLALTASLIYVGVTGWYLTAVDVVLLVVDVIILTTFGTALSSIINYFLSSQGQISAVGSIVSSCYGFVCGAYMPLSSFSDGLRNVLMFLPGTYGTSIIRNHSVGSVLTAMENSGIDAVAIESVKDAIDCNIYFFDSAVSMPVMYAVTLATIVLLLGAYILINVFAKKGKR